MKLAALAVTEKGAALALKLRRDLPCAVFVKEGRASVREEGVVGFASLPALIGEIFLQYDGFIFIMAAGIAVRMIAPYIAHKAYDPAVIVLDDCGKHAISLLSGHIGGANALTEKIAALLGAQPVITTATDVNGRLAADALAVALGMRIANLERLKIVNAALAAGQAVDFFLDAHMENAGKYRAALERRGIDVKSARLLSGGFFGEAVLLTDEKRVFSVPETVLLLHPGKLAVGVGCRRGTRKEEILFALRDACAQVDKTLDDVASLASTTVKREEAGLLEAKRALRVPLYFYDHAVLQEVIETHRLSVSDFVWKQIGVGNVCESAAIASSRSKKLALRKTKYPRVTVALAWEQ